MLKKTGQKLLPACVSLKYLSLLHSVVDIFVLLKLLQLCLHQHLSDVHHLLHSQGQTLHREAELLLHQHTDRSGITIILAIEERAPLKCLFHSPVTWSSVWWAAGTGGRWSGFLSRWSVFSVGSDASLAAVLRKWAGTSGELVFIEGPKTKT